MVTKVYVDASRGEFSSGIGYVVEAEDTHVGKRTLDGTYTSMEAEHLALVEGLRIASQRSQSNEYCEAYSDCKPLIAKMRGNQNRSDDWDRYYDSCHWLLDKFDDWELNHCSRSETQQAHELARIALREGRKT